MQDALRAAEQRHTNAASGRTRTLLAEPYKVYTAVGEYLTQAEIVAQRHRGIGHDSARRPASACATPAAKPMLLLSEMACSYL